MTSTPRDTGFTGLQLHLDVDQSPIEVLGGLAGHGRISDVALLRSGTATGRATIAVAVLLADGSKVIGETTYDLFAAAARAFEASPIVQALPPKP